MRSDYPNLFQVLNETARQHGEGEAFVAPGERLHWNDVLAKTRQMAAALHAAGVRKGDHVGILLGNSGTWLSSFFACATIGAVTVPVNTRFKLDELEFCLKQADVKLLIVADRFLGIDLAGLVAQVEPAVATGLPGSRLPRLEKVVIDGDAGRFGGAVSMHDFIAGGEAVPAATLDTLAKEVAADDLLLIQYTSGTTSFPKGVMLTHQNMLRNAAAVAQRIGVRPDDRYFSIRPFFHVAGSTLSILVALNTGCCLLTLPKFDVAETLRMLDEERCTLTSGNDTIFLMIMGHPAFDRSRIHLRGGWAAAGWEVMHKIRDLMGVRHMCNAYGQSEASPNVSFSSWDDPFELRAMGFALPHAGNEVRIVDPASGQEVPRGSQGEIRTRGWNVMRGYYNMPEATAKALDAEGWLHTGDLGEMDGQGRIRIVGRLKDLFRVGGENVAPAEVEETLHGHEAVQMAQVIGVPDERLGEVGAAFILLKEGKSASTEELIDWCKQRCANFKVPRYLAIVDSFEHIGMTGSSKVQKNKLREHAVEVFGLGAKK
jgi:fatty-acyl-CoA synthase